MPRVRELLQIGMPTLSRFCWKQEPLLVQFDEIASVNLPPHGLLLDAGCGSQARVSAQGKCKMVVGVDREKPEITAVSGFNEIVLGDLSVLPFECGIFDVIVSWMVVEHLENPQACFKELNRVCKDDGVVVLATPNVLHYAIMATKLTPYWFHEWFRRVMLKSQDSSHRTTYKANNPKKLVNMMQDAGFKCVEMRLIDFSPIYLSWLSLAYFIGLLYHRMVNRLGWLSFLRANIIGVFQKQA